MKHNWEYKRLGDICEILDSKRKPVTKCERKPGPYPYYGASGIQDYVSDYIFDGDFLLVGEDGAKWGAHEKSAFSISGKSWVNNHAHILDFKNSPASQKFVEYILCSRDLNKIITGAVVPKLTQKNLISIQIPVPPMEVQERIVAELDQINDLIAKSREMLSQLDSLAQSLFYDTFGDPISNPKGYIVSPLSDVFSIITDGTHQTPTYTEDKINGIKFLSAKDVVNGYIDWSNIKYIPFDLHLELHKRLAPQRGDILLCKNGTTGICALVETDDVFDIYVSLALLRSKENMNVKFLVYAINNPFTKEQFNHSLKGIGVPNLHLNKIRATKIPVPPLALQEEFAAKVEAIEAQKKRVEAEIAELRTLLNARMDYWFN